MAFWGGPEGGKGYPMGVSRGGSWGGSKMAKK